MPAFDLRRMLFRLGALAVSVALASCATLRTDLPKPASTSLPPVADTPSTLKLLASVLWPATLNCPIGDRLPEGCCAITTPGVSCSSVLKLRPLRGRLSTNCRSITVPTAADSVLTSGALPWIVTISDTEPSGSAKLIASAS